MTQLRDTKCYKKNENIALVEKRGSDGKTLMRTFSWSTYKSVLCSILLLIYRLLFCKTESSTLVLRIGV